MNHRSHRRRAAIALALLALPLAACAVTDAPADPPANAPGTPTSQAPAAAPTASADAQEPAPTTVAPRPPQVPVVTGPPRPGATTEPTTAPPSEPGGQAGPTPAPGIREVPTGGPAPVAGERYDLAVLCSAELLYWVRERTATGDIESIGPRGCSRALPGGIELGVPGEWARVYADAPDLSGVAAERAPAGQGFSAAQRAALAMQLPLEARFDVVIWCGTEDRDLAIGEVVHTCTPNGAVVFDDTALEAALTSIRTPEGFTGYAILQPLG
ncbi:hypothetical protein LG314_01055 [Agrococcus terreus]|uniref:hypothetical protein n=1 Tax=Agrococcus terreus TaxID=574649 RepID=UPI00384B7B97